MYLQYLVPSNDGTPDYLTFMGRSWSVLPISRYSLLTREFVVNPERDNVYLAEFTFTPAASITRLRYDWDLRIGGYLDLKRARREIAEHRPIIL